MDNLKYFLELAEISYKSKEDIEKQLDGARYFDSLKWSDECAQFYLYYKGSTLYIVFRGSSSASDFVTDVKFFLNELPNEFLAQKNNVKVHSGFLEQFLSVRSTIINQIALCPVSFEVCVIGHSLGGSLATICAFYLKTVYPKRNVKCVTFGSPRVGNDDFVKKFNEILNKSIRCVNADDIVTRRPYWGYMHVNGEYLIGKSSNVFYNFFGSVRDHYLSSYSQSLSEK
jgi:hypothetical protein